MKRLLFFTLGIFLMAIIPATYSAVKATVAPYTSTQQSTESLKPEQALRLLIDGNARFVNNQPTQRNLLQQAKATSLKGQFPFAVILSCMDSRGSPELIFDQGLGDVFSIRVAGNIIDTDQLGSMEFATKVTGSKLIVVMGHSACGAVKGACQDVEMGNITGLLKKIQPAVKRVKSATQGNINCEDPNTLDAIAKENVLDMMKQIKKESSIIRDQIQNKQVLLVGAMHQLTTGNVTFFNENGEEIK